MAEMSMGYVKLPASGSPKGWIGVVAGLNTPPLTVPTTPFTLEVQLLLGPALTSPLTAIEPPVTSKSAFCASTLPRKQSVHFTVVLTAASAWLPTLIVEAPVTPPKKVETVLVGIQTRIFVGEVALSN